MECPICYEDEKKIELTITICNHIFCKKCINSIINSNKSKCPICRIELIDKKCKKISNELRNKKAKIYLENKKIYIYIKGSNMAMLYLGNNHIESIKKKITI